MAFLESDCVCFYLSSLSKHTVYMHFIATENSGNILSVEHTREPKNTCICLERSWIFLNTVELDFFKAWLSFELFLDLFLFALLALTMTLFSQLLKCNANTFIGYGSHLETPFQLQKRTESTGEGLHTFKTRTTGGKTPLCP